MSVSGNENLKKYSVWSLDRDDEGEDICLVEGEDIPRYANGTPQSDDNSLKFVIHACSLEEAMAVMHIRLGWEPWKPLGKSEECPSCNQMYWPDSFGICWNCGHKS